MKVYGTKSAFRKETFRYRAIFKRRYLAPTSASRYQYRRCRVANYPFGDAADEPSSDAALTMAGHHDQTSRDILGEVNDFRRRTIDSPFNDFGR